MSRPQVAIAFFLCAACMPTVLHGPRVEPGLSAGAVGSYTAGTRYPNGDDGPRPFGYGPAGVGIAYSWKPERGLGFGYRLGAYVPVPFVVGVQPDAYVQFPKAALLGLDGGVGVVIPEPLESSMPYAQLGYISPSGAGFFLTYGVLREKSDPDRNHPVIRDEAVLPGAAVQWREGRITTRLFVTEMKGRRWFRCSVSDPSPCRSEKRWAIATGLAFEMSRRNQSHDP